MLTDAQRERLRLLTQSLDVVRVELANGRLTPQSLDALAGRSLERRQNGALHRALLQLGKVRVVGIPCTVS